MTSQAPTAPTTGPITRRRFLSLAAMATAATACGVPESSSGGGGASKIKAATYIPPSYGDLFPAFDMLFKGATKASGGDLAFEMFHSETLLNAEQLMPGLIQGVADMAFQTSSYISTTYPVLGAYELPFVNDGVQQTQRALEVGSPLYDLINTELGKKDLRLVASMPTSLEYIWTVDKPIRKPDDMRGLRIRTAGNVEGETVKAMGGSPVSMSSAEVYQALERGTIDGMLSYMGTVVSRDLQQVLRYGTQGHFGDYSVDAYVRKDWFDELDTASQDALLEGGRAYHQRGTAHQLRVHEEDYLPRIEEAGIEIIEPSPAELKAFEDAVPAVYDWWRNLFDDPATADRALELVRSA